MATGTGAITVGAGTIGAGTGAFGVGTTIGVGTTGVGPVGMLRDKLLSLCNNRANTSISDNCCDCCALRRRLFDFCDASYHSFFSFLSDVISNKSGMCNVCWRSRRNGNLSSSTTAVVVVTHTTSNINVIVYFIILLVFKKSVYKNKKVTGTCCQYRCDFLHC